MKLDHVLILGGSGFVGRSIANRLAARGVRLRIPTRRRAAVRHLLPLPTAEVIECDIFDEATLDRLVDGVDAVVNLVGVLHSRSGEPFGPDFRRAHVELPERLVAACRKQGVEVSGWVLTPQGRADHEKRLADELDAAFALNEGAWGKLDPQGNKMMLSIQAGEQASQNYRRLRRALAGLMPICRPTAFNTLSTVTNSGLPFSESAR